jgi:hypothetical protein
MCRYHKEFWDKKGYLYCGGNMSLNSWSLIFFGSQALLYLSIYFAMFSTPPNMLKFIFATFLWFVQLFVTLIYGMSTGQIGFVLIFFLEIAMIMFVYTVTGKMKYYDSNEPK